MTLSGAVDGRLFAPGTPHRLAAVRRALALVVGVRLLLGPFRGMQPPPGALFQPPPFLSWLGAMPGPGPVLVLVCVGAAAAFLAAAGRWERPGLLVAWACLLVAAGLKGSYGKVLHNDVLLVLAVVPLLPAPAGRLGDRAASPMAGWPVRACIAVVAMVYCATGVQKLAHSGPAWVTGDNMRWILYQAADGDRVRWPGVPLAVADRPWLAHLVAAVLLAGELLAPLLLVSRRARRGFVAYAVLLHAGTWLTVGLDYWVWPLTVAAVVLPGGERRAAAAVPEGRRPGRPVPV